MLFLTKFVVVYRKEKGGGHYGCLLNISIYTGLLNLTFQAR